MATKTAVPAPPVPGVGFEDSVRQVTIPAATGTPGPGHEGIPARWNSLGVGLVFGNTIDRELMAGLL